MCIYIYIYTHMWIDTQIRICMRARAGRRQASFTWVLTACPELLYFAKAPGGGGG